RPHTCHPSPYTTLFRSRNCSAISGLRMEPSSAKLSQARGIGCTIGTAHPRSARTTNSMVLIACRPCTPPAVLIKPTTLSVKYGRSEEHTSELQSRVDLV